MSVSRNKKRGVLFGVILPMVVIIGIGAFFVGVRRRMITSMPEVRAVDGVVDIREVPIEKEVYHLVNNWDFFKGKLYYPEDFRDAANAPSPSADNERDDHLGTYRVRILAKPDTYLMLASFSIDYSMRIFVNGTEVRNIGYVSEDPAEAKHGARYLQLPLYTGDGEI